jgi:hypothetical protein
MPLTAINSTNQYLAYSAQDTATRADIDAYLSGSSTIPAITKAAAAVLAQDVSALLTQLQTRIGQVERAVRSQGRVFVDTKRYGTDFQEMADSLSIPLVVDMRQRAQTGSSEVTGMSSVGSDLENVSHYASSSADFYTAYAGHLRDRRERLGSELRDLTDAYNFLIMVYEVAVEKSA